MYLKGFNLSAALQLDIYDRHYNPEIGRFISEDPIGFRGGDMNLYRYVGNGAINYTDPFGLIVIGAGLGGSIPFISSDAQIVFDDDGNIALALTYCITSGLNFGISGGIVTSVSTGDTVESLEGSSQGLEGTIGGPGGGITGGYTKGDPIGGFNNMDPYADEGERPLTFCKQTSLGAEHPSLGGLKCYTRIVKF